VSKVGHFRATVERKGSIPSRQVVLRSYNHTESKEQDSQASSRRPPAAASRMRSLSSNCRPWATMKRRESEYLVNT
jgi:hypothetical protein